MSDSVPSTRTANDDAKAICPSEAVPCGTTVATETPGEVTAENLEAILEAAGCRPSGFPDVSSKPESLAELRDFGPATQTDFPHAEVMARLDCEPEPAFADSTAPDAAELIRIIFDFLTDVDAHDGRGVKSMGLRVLAASWVVNPARWNNVPGKTLANLFGLHHDKFSRKAAEFSRRMGGFRNGWQMQGVKKIPNNEGGDCAQN